MAPLYVVETLHRYHKGATRDKIAAMGYPCQENKATAKGGNGAGDDFMHEDDPDPYLAVQ